MKELSAVYLVSCLCMSDAAQMMLLLHLKMIPPDPPTHNILFCIALAQLCIHTCSKGTVQGQRKLAKQ